MGPPPAGNQLVILVSGAHCKRILMLESATKAHQGKQMTRLKLCAIAVVMAAVVVVAQTPAVPKDLRPLLAPRHSEMRLVTTRYNADRNLLVTNYAGVTNTGGRGGRGE